MKSDTMSIFTGIRRAATAALALALFAGAAQAAEGGTHYYVNDHLATTVGIADAAGEIAALEADAFGSPLAAGQAPNRYTGKPYDEDLGAFVFPFRNYRADEARWMSADPSGFPDGVNSTAYMVRVLHGMDPLGLLTKNYSGSWISLEFWGRSKEAVSWSEGTVTSTSSSTTTSWSASGSAGYSRKDGPSGSASGSYSSSNTNTSGSQSSSDQQSGWGSPELLSSTRIGKPAALFTPDEIEGYDFTGWVGSAPTDVLNSINNSGWGGSSSDIVQTKLISRSYDWAGVANYKKRE